MISSSSKLGEAKGKAERVDHLVYAYYQLGGELGNHLFEKTAGEINSFERSGR